VRIKVIAAALNFSDALQLQGLYQEKPKLPFIPGSEVSGKVVEAGNDVRTLTVGDLVRSSSIPIDCKAQYTSIPLTPGLRRAGSTKALLNDTSMDPGLCTDLTEGTLGRLTWCANLPNSKPYVWEFVVGGRGEEERRRFTFPACIF
jgi:hypothetical protein